VRTQVDSGRVLGKIPSDKEVAESEALVAEIMSLQVCCALIPNKTTEQEMVSPT
jgi:hypothetical protein